MTNTCIKVLQLILRTRTKNAKYRCTCSRHWQINGRGPRKKHKGKMPAEQAKQNYPPPLHLLVQGLNLPVNTLTNTIFYGKQFKFNDKAIIELELVVTKCSICKCLAYHYGNNNNVQPLEDMKHCSVFFAHIIYYLHNDLSMLMRKVEKLCWAEVKHSHSNTMACISFRVNPVEESILPNLLWLPPRCNQIV